MAKRKIAKISRKRRVPTATKAKRTAPAKKGGKKKTNTRKKLASAKKSKKKVRKAIKAKSASRGGATKSASSAKKTVSRAVRKKKSLKSKMPKTAKAKTPKGRTAKKVKASRATPSATSWDPIRFPEEQGRIPKTHLKAKKLREFKQLLLQKRMELVGDVRHLTSEALGGIGPATADHSTMPMHMADLGTDNWEREFTLGLIASERALVSEIDNALERIAKKTYGVCLATHRPISMARLRAKPWAKYCIEYARAREEGRAL